MNSTTIIIYIVAAALIAYAIFQTVQKFRGKSKSSCCGTPEVKSTRKVEDTDESHYPYRYTLKVEGMKCSGCAANVESAFNNLEGVWARVNLGKHEAKILSKTERSPEDFETALALTTYRIKSVN